MASDTSIARRDLLVAAGAGLATGLLTEAAAQAETARSGPEFWTAEYVAKKGEVSLQMYRKRIGAPAAGEAAKPVFFLVHGSSTGAQASFDLNVPGRGEYSVMNVFARLGYDVWYIEDSGANPYDPRQQSIVEDPSYNIGFVKAMMERFDHAAPISARPT